MKNKKRSKLELDQNVEYDSEDVSGSEEEYSEGERRLLDKVREKRTTENFDSEDEIYGFEDNEEEEKDSMASDIEGLPEDDDLPNERAWGKKKRAFYSTDYVDQDYSSASRKDLADAEMEEKEARNIQKRLAEQLDDADFGLDLFQAEGEPSDTEEGQVVKTDLSKLGKREKQALLQKESPELQALVVDFKDRMAEAVNILVPFLNLVKRGKCPECSAVSFVRTKYELILNYGVNVGFYLMLKAKRLPVASHPVIKRLAQYRQLLGQMESDQGKLLVKAKEIIEADKAGVPIYSVADNTVIGKETKVKKKKVKILEPEKKTPPMESQESMDVEMDDEELMSNENAALSEDENLEETADKSELLQEDEKRGITYQIAKNKGLTPHRKKEQRNPRVKHRNKYRKAKIRRKGAVREVRKEINRYAGEISGIKTSVKKSIRIK